MHPAVQEYLADLIPLLQQKGVMPVSTREIQYGVQLELLRGSETLKLNVYQSKTRGVNTLINKGGSEALAALVQSIIGKATVHLPEPVQLHDWDTWIGSDECGKGDYFGALVVCAFRINREDLPKLSKLGVRDSKALKDIEIKDIAKKLYAAFPGASNSIILKPATYNRVYTDMKKYGKNLNDLLAWQHAQVITELYNSSKGVQGVLVDQFSPSKKVARLLSTKLPLLPVVERTGAEADLAVAAASISARFQFLQAHEELSKRYKMDLPLGATHVQARAQSFVDQYGFNRLGEVVKLHFVITSRLQQKDIFGGR
ncbi:MAG TPA: ribonuclease HIII [Candidatus Cloacimonadota bacterium]|nr:ribonuclease HIII [Candidatus Cloacimonadota bacterium]